MKQDEESMKTESFVSLVLFIVVMEVFTLLLWWQRISGSEYVVLFLSAGVMALGLYGFRRLREFDLKNLRFVLSEIRDVQQSIYAKEEDLRSIAFRLAEILAVTVAFQGRWGSQRSNELKRRWYRSKARNLLNEIQVPPDRREKVFSVLDALDEMDQMEASDERSEKFDEILRQIEDDLWAGSIDR
jgi:hypothetical protein